MLAGSGVANSCTKEDFCRLVDCATWHATG